MLAYAPLLASVWVAMTTMAQTLEKTPPFYPDKRNLLLYQDERGAMVPVK